MTQQLPVAMDRVRLEMEYLTDAVVWASDNGGWIVWDHDRNDVPVLWFGPRWTMSEIIKEVDYLCCTIATWQTAAEEVVRCEVANV